MGWPFRKVLHSRDTRRDTQPLPLTLVMTHQSNHLRFRYWDQSGRTGKGALPLTHMNSLAWIPRCALCIGTIGSGQPARRGMGVGGSCRRCLKMTHAGEFCLSVAKAVCS